jgi:protein-S-isoprenylcysteine O-methyltransferase
MAATAMLTIAATIALGLWPLSELAVLAVLARRGRGAEIRDRYSLALLLGLVPLGVACAIGARHAAPALAFAETPGRMLAIGLTLAGIGLRWTAIITLGRAFTMQVAVRDEQRLVQRGIYSLVRHPAYTGVLMCQLAIGCYLSNVLSVACALLPGLLAVLYRVRVEEHALSERFGSAYAHYRARTKRLVPYLF